MGIFNILKKSRTKPAPRKKSGKPTSDIKRKEAEPIKKNPPKKKEAFVSRLLKEPHISEKATLLAESGKYIFKIYKKANKSEIKKAITSLYGVAVKEVNIINIKSKQRILKGKKGERRGYKKAIVTLERGHKIEILPH